MFRVSLANAFAHRTLRPLHEKHQATPVAGTLFVGTGGTTSTIYSGMAAQLDSTGAFKLADNTTTNVWGLFALDHNSVIDDLEGQPADLAPFAVWQGGPDAYFRVDAPAINVTGTISVGSPLLVDSTGALAVTGATGTIGTTKIGHVVEVVSATRWVIQLLLPANV